MSLIDKFKNCFDRIFIILHISKNDRRENVKRQMDYLGLTEPFTHIFYTADHFAKNISLSLWNKHIVTKPFESNGVFDLYLNHLSIMSLSLSLGYDRVLVLEDDFHSLKDLNKINDYLDNMPDEYDLIQYDYTLAETNKSIMDNADEYYIKRKNGQRLWATSAYAVSRRGMDMYLKIQETNYKLICPVSDLPVCHMSDFSDLCYISRDKLFTTNINDSSLRTFNQIRPDILELNKFDSTKYYV